MGRDDEAGRPPDAPTEPEPGATSHLLRAIEQNDMAESQLGRKLTDRSSRKTRRILGQPKHDNRKTTPAQSRKKLFEQSGLAGAFRSDNGPAVFPLFQPRHEIIPSQVPQPIADLMDARRGEGIVTRPHSCAAGLPRLW